MVRAWLGFAVAAAVWAQSAPEKPLTELPYTPSLETKFLDRSADPCVDFYQFACGNWNKLNPIPPDQARWDVYSKLHDDNLRYLWGLLDQASRPAANRTANEQKIGDYFAACMDEATVNRLGAAPLKPLLDSITGIKKVSDIAPVLARLHIETGADALFGFGSSQDFSDSEQVIAFAVAGGLGLPDRDYYTKTDDKSRETRARYVEHVAAILRLLGDSPAAARGGAQTVMAIETALAQASLTRVDKRDPYKVFHKLTAAQLAAATPSFRWADYWKASGLAAPGAVNVTEPDFFAALERELKERPLADWKTYLRWQAAHAAAPYLSDAFVKANFEFYGRRLRGVEQIQPRWKRCVSYVDGQLGEALGQVFVARTFTPETKARALEMVRQIEAAMERDLREITWMSGATKEQALAKLHAVTNKIGYPDKWRDYSSVRVERGDFLGNFERATAFESHRQLAKIGKPVDRGEWEMTPPTVDAYYDPQKNDINFPAGVLQPPLFDPKMDDAPNYGNTGATIGHELTHGFDDQGRQFDARGNLRDWWTKQDAEEFVRRAACVSDQYSQYTVVDDIKINGKLTLGEDVADLGGTTLAYMAWKAATRGQELKSVDGFTPEQRFFIGMAQWACGYERPESKRMHAITDEHSPDEYRINGVVSNMPEFRDAFSCHAGQPMARENACKVW
ncbi:MAG TPA: M13 family metallopeptidase [Bryobacteraceae bacterium]|jgi:endothelin-converting enzyme/putative endopeptidase|nr:M13 family metallopeptidase [Bryobacteraceae bacterium]